jgi:hypothetical protein
VPSKQFLISQKYKKKRGGLIRLIGAQSMDKCAFSLVHSNESMYVCFKFKSIPWTFTSILAKKFDLKSIIKPGTNPTTCGFTSTYNASVVVD